MVWRFPRDFGEAPKKLTRGVNEASRANIYAETFKKPALLNGLTDFSDVL